MLKKLWFNAQMALVKMDIAVTDYVWEGRWLSLPEQLSQTNCGQLIEKIGELAKASDKPILLVCDSSGGMLFPALTLCDTIRDCRVPVVTMVYYAACSAAVHVFAAGHLRLMRPKALLGTHAGEFHGRERLEKVLANVEYTGSVDEVYDALRSAISDHSKKYLDTFAKRKLPDELFAEDMTFSGVMACRKLGLADGIFLRPPVEAWWRAKKLMRPLPTVMVG